jgi:hypothetical protein
MLLVGGQSKPIVIDKARYPSRLTNTTYQVEICCRELRKASATDELLMTSATLFYITPRMVDRPQLDIAVVTPFGELLNVILCPHSL